MIRVTMTLWVAICLLSLPLLANASEATDKFDRAFDALFEHAENQTGDDKLAKSLHLHQLLADVGYARSTTRLGDFYADGIEVEKDVWAAEKFYRIAARLGDHTALVELGKLLNDQARHGDAIAAFDVAFEKGVKRAKLELAIGHLRSEFGEHSDPRHGFKQMTEVADTGSNYAVFEIAEAYRLGRFVERNFVIAVVLYTKLTASGHPTGTERLAEYYASDAAEPEQRTQAVELYRSAISKGRTTASIKLVRLLIDLNRGEEAFEVIEKTTGKAAKDLRDIHAIGHLDGLFGKYSDEGLGKDALVAQISNNSVLAAKKAALLLIEGDTRFEDETAAVTKILDRAATKGDAKAVQILIPLYRERATLFEDAHARKSQLLAKFGNDIPAPVLFREIVYDFVYDTPSAPPEELLVELRNAGVDGYRAGMFQAHILDNGLFNDLIQAEFVSLGLAELTPSNPIAPETINAIATFCDLEGYGADCQAWPPTTTGVMNIVNSVAARRF